jgi:hypothetical protein
MISDIPVNKYYNIPNFKKTSEPMVRVHIIITYYLRFQAEVNIFQQIIA